MASPEQPSAAALYVLVSTDDAGRPVKAVEAAEAAALERALHAQAPERAASPPPLALLAPPKAEDAPAPAAAGDDAGALYRQVELADALLTAAVPLAAARVASAPHHHASSARPPAAEVRRGAARGARATADTRAGAARARKSG
jgi:hypothetical protein